MKNTFDPSIMFNCPQCKANFEFDNVEQGEFVPCPVCGVHFVTIKSDNNIKLAAIEQAFLC